MPSLPVVCLVCHKVIRTIEVSRELRPNDSSSGICDDCLGPVHVTLFGRSMERLDDVTTLTPEVMR